MDVGLYISELLREQNAVSLPGIGTFFIKKVNAVHDDAQGLFFPPYNEVGFKTASFSASPELIRHISTSKNISELSARYFIEKYAASLKLSLKNTGIAEINRVGTLRGSEHGFTFQSDAIHSNQLMFGLKPVKDPAFNPNARRVPVSPEKIQDSILSNHRNPYPPRPAVRRTAQWPVIVLSVIVVFMAITAGILYFQPRLFDEILQQVGLGQGGDESELALLQDEFLHEDSLRQADSMAADTLTAPVPVMADTLAVNPDTVVKKKEVTASSAAQKPAAATLKYEVISASFNRMAEAENYVAVMKKRGIKARVVEDTRRPKFKVSLGGYTDQASAEEKKRQVHADINKEAWIFKH